jgi:Arc/MetJ-type ribon-helix-helix transcriptional regulator
MVSMAQPSRASECACTLTGKRNSPLRSTPAAPKGAAVFLRWLQNQNCCRGQGIGLKFAVTLSVILITLVGQGLLLPWVVRVLGLQHAGRNEREINRIEEYQARSEAVQAAIEQLEQLAVERNLSTDVIEAVRTQHRDRLAHFESRTDGDHKSHGDLHDEVERLLIATERTRINDLFRSGKFKGRSEAPNRAGA